MNYELNQLILKFVNCTLNKFMQIVNFPNTGNGCLACQVLVLISVIRLVLSFAFSDLHLVHVTHKQIADLQTHYTLQCDTCCFHRIDQRATKYKSGLKLKTKKKKKCSVQTQEREKQYRLATTRWAFFLQPGEKNELFNSKQAFSWPFVCFDLGLRRLHECLYCHVMCTQRVNY